MKQPRLSNIIIAMIACSCPAEAALPDIPAVVCPESFGQIQKVAFQRLYKADGTRNSFGGTGQGALPITSLASWTAKLAAENDEKIVISPFIQAPTNEPGGARVFGGGNETLGGIEMIVGREPNAFNGVFRMIPQSIIKEIKKLQCESYADNLGIYLFDENGAIESIGDGTGVASTVRYAIPIRSLFISDKGHGGLEAPDNNLVQWVFLPNYSDDIRIDMPTDFNPLTGLRPAA